MKKNVLVLAVLFVAAFCAVSAAVPAPEFIGHEKALEIAIAHAGAANAKIYDVDVEFKNKRGGMIYDVEFSADGMEYEYDIDAKTGEILKSRKHMDD